MGSTVTFWTEEDHFKEWLEYGEVDFGPEGPMLVSKVDEVRDSEIWFRGSWNDDKKYGVTFKVDELLCKTKVVIEGGVKFKGEEYVEDKPSPWHHPRAFYPVSDDERLNEPRYWMVKDPIDLNSNDPTFWLPEPEDDDHGVYCFTTPDWFLEGLERLKPSQTNH